MSTQPDRGLRRVVLIVALLNLAYFGIEFAVAVAIGSVSLFADSVDFLEDASVNLLIFVANWPSARRHPWSTLLRARAIENLSYCLGVNRVGVDGNDLHYSGDSAALDFLGQPLVELGAQEQVVTVTLDPAALAAHRERFPAWMDADEFTILR